MGRITAKDVAMKIVLSQLLTRTPIRTFILWPLIVAAFEAVAQRHAPEVHPWALAIMAWGYLQYHYVGRYRKRIGGGGPGLTPPPVGLVTDGPYRWCRNPMYLGHLIFLSGLCFFFASWFGAAVVLFHVVWFERRVRRDEVHIGELFGDAYREYCARVKRWLPGVY